MSHTDHDDAPQRPEDGSDPMTSDSDQPIEANGSYALEDHFDWAGLIRNTAW